MRETATRAHFGLQHLASTVRTLRAPLLCALLAFFVLSSPAQVLELYLLLARDWRPLWPQVALAATSLVALSIVIMVVSRALLSSDSGTADASKLGRIAPVGHGLLPLMGAAYGIYKALQSVLSEYVIGTSEIVSGLQSEEAASAALSKLKELALSSNVEAGSVAKLNDLLTSLVPQAIVELPTRTAELTVSMYAAIGYCVAVALVLGWRHLAEPLGSVRAACFDRSYGRRFSCC